MPRLKEEIPKNQVRAFDIDLDYRLFEDLVLIYETQIFGATIGLAAESLVLEWAREKNIPHQYEQLGISLEDAKLQGYVPMVSDFTLGKVQQSRNLELRFGGMPRYYFEMFPKAEHSRIRNPFYQKSPEDVILHALREKIHEKINEMRKSGWLDDGDESYLH